MDKLQLKAALLAKLTDQHSSVEADYDAKVAETMPDAGNVVSVDEHAQAVAAAEIADALDSDVHGVEARMAFVERLNFGPKTAAEEGALVQVGDTFYIIAVSMPKFSFQGKTVVGLASTSPLFAAMDGLAAGDSFTFNQRQLKIASIA